MVWVPGGALVAGTPPHELPRVPDEEMPGEQVILHGFYIDVFPYPNEEGAIPHTNVTRSEAATLCKQAGKRLCTELEWERACKGKENHTYEYGNRYRADACGTGAPPSMLPSGLRFGCQSDFGVRDMHGGVWEWTSSMWGRGTDEELASLRGGNGRAGELVGRCANARSERPGRRSADIGFRCCAGNENDAEVQLTVLKGTKLEQVDPPNRRVADQMIESPPTAMRAEVGDRRFESDRMWIWRPIGNEELVLVGGCAGLATQPACGVLLGRPVAGRPRVLGWVSSGHWAPSIHSDVDARDLWLFGGDDLGSFKRRISYTWGRVAIGEKERKVPRPPTRRFTR